LAQIRGTPARATSSLDLPAYQNDGKRASGTATFLELYAVIGGKVEPVKGTFEFACE